MGNFADWARIEAAMEPDDSSKPEAEVAEELEWERQKQRLRRRELLITVIGAAMFLVGMVIAFFKSAGR
jgi:hypothetical protein